LYVRLTVIDTNNDASEGSSPTAPAPSAAPNIKDGATGGNGVAQDFIIKGHCKGVESVAEDSPGRLEGQTVSDTRNIEQHSECASLAE
jgi:hypothetical protein